MRVGRVTEILLDSIEIRTHAQLALTTLSPENIAPSFLDVHQSKHCDFGEDIVR